jgi:hypothetical protein
MSTCQDCIFWKRRKFYWVKYEMTDWRDNKTKYINEDYLETTQIADYKTLEYKEFDSKFGKCSNNKFIYTKAGGCIDSDDIKNKNNNDSLLYSDGEAYGAYFITGENFGCIHHERIPLNT